MAQEKEKNMIFQDERTGIAYIDTLAKAKRTKRAAKVISLFTGAGGLDLGLEEAGFTTVACVEINRDCCETLRKNRPGWKLFEDNRSGELGDVKKVSSTELLKFAGLKKGEAALVVGGAPCQPFSNIGKRLGEKDPTNGNLFLDFVRIVEDTKPQAFIFENVRGITHKAHCDIVQYMRKKFNRIGYAVSSCVVNAADYGVPQKRKRFILIGNRNISRPPAFPLPTHAKDKESWEKLIAFLNPKPYQRPKKWIPIKKAFSSIPKAVFKRDDYLVMRNSEVIKERMSYIGPGQNFKTLPLRLRPNCWKNGRHQGQDTFGRLKIDEPSVTVRTAAYNPTKGKYIHPVENRGLNTMELASIQGFPSSWQFYCAAGKSPTLVSISRQIGNAVPPPLAKALGLAIMQQLA